MGYPMFSTNDNKPSSVFVIIYLRFRVLLTVQFQLEDSPTKFGFLPCGAFPFSLMVSHDIVSVEPFMNVYHSFP